ncbi:hypothetical protein C900_04748 [Fulvivirga imtechensis AK7]|uniref:Porin n=1 Tax=Fulvivirga imtechensis AK7 TaxID=1237149 RepID=L8K1C5_9BACT|nr:putative porin [Fulvivirga imtechensis]ELR73237.1 hypothetical protein C900_04748 [Fulvivirga imtechensis AK7]
MEFRLAAIILVFLSLANQAFSQIEIPEEGRKDRVGSGILDDSTKQVYGPSTTRFTFERNIKYNNPHYWNIDTSVVDLHKYQFVAQTENLYQNLGNIGTAMNPIYPQIPHQIGATSGFNIYDIFYQGPEEVRYFDTRSPYSKFGIIWGGRGRSITEAAYTRNIDERSNFGFDFRGLFIDKQIQRRGRGDRHAEGIYYRGFGSYSTRNGRYTILGSFIRNRHKVDEYGGILTDGTENSNDVFFDQNRQITLTNAETDELRTNYHIYHQYKLNDFIQLYHSYDRYKQQNDFLDQLDTTQTFFDFIEVDSAIVKDRSKLIYRMHEIGVKGDIGKTFYNFYYKARDVDFRYKYLPDTLNFETKYLENYGGFNLRFGNDSISYISAYGEYKLGGEYRFGAEIRNSWFFAEAVSAKYLPAYIQRAYRGSHDFWINDFKSPISSGLKAGFLLKLGPIALMPSGEYNLLTNYVYFRKFNVDEGEQSVLPVQASGDINLLKGQFDLSVDFLRHFNFKTKVIYANVSGGSADAISVPELFGNGQISYANIFFKGNLELQTGIDVHVKTAYEAQAYDPAIMQFYVGEGFEVPFFPVLDIFVNAKINRGRFFIKYNNFMKLFRENGYFLTPDYPAQDNVLDFGINWAFYD